MANVKRALLIIAPGNFRDEELFETERILETAKIKTTVASSKTGMIKGMLGGTQEVKKSILDINVADYDAVIFIGGSGAAVYFDDAIALAIVEEVARQGKVLGAICIAPSILANAGILQGRKATVFISEKKNLISGGAKYTGESVVVDGRIITASGPAAARDFAWKIVELLK